MYNDTLENISKDILIDGLSFSNFSDDQVSSEGKLHSIFLEDEERLFVADGRTVGCRGILDGKILLDTILECEKEDSLSIKIELDIVQVISLV